MHDSSMNAGRLFVEAYGFEGGSAVDIGGRDMGGSLREFFQNKKMKFTSVDIDPHESVDVVVVPGEPLPFADGSFDFAVSTSCFEHDPCFWLTFKEMARVVKVGGYIYVNAPTRGFYHAHPGDNWRFFSDAGQALAYWSGFEPAWPVEVVETFHIMSETTWNDFTCVWRRCTEKQTAITVQHEVNSVTGPLEQLLKDAGMGTAKRC